MNWIVVFKKLNSNENRMRINADWKECEKYTQKAHIVSSGIWIKINVLTFLSTEFSDETRVTNLKWYWNQNIDKGKKFIQSAKKKKFMFYFSSAKLNLVLVQFFLCVCMFL